MKKHVLWPIVCVGPRMLCQRCWSKQMFSQVFAGLFPSDQSEFVGLRSAVERLTLNDSSVSIHPDSRSVSSEAWMQLPYWLVSCILGQNIQGGSRAKQYLYKFCLAFLKQQVDKEKFYMRMVENVKQVIFVCWSILHRYWATQVCWSILHRYWAIQFRSSSSLFCRGPL